MPVGGSQSTDQRNHNYVNETTQQTATGSSPVIFQYDGNAGASNGNLKNDGTLIYAYDALNRPIQINRVSDGLIIATYLYDAMNRRVRKTILNGGLTGNIPNGTNDYIWMGNQVMEERNPFGGSGSTDTPIRQYIWGTYIDECIQLTTLTTLGPQNLPAGAYYLLQDLLYRAVALTNSSGAMVEAYDCDAYGNTLIFTAPGADGVWFTDDDVQSSYGANEIIYCGYPDNNRVSTDIGTGLNDPETKLYYLRNRTYGSIPGTVLRQEPKSRQATGVATRVLQRDPIGYAGGINLYEYGGGRTPVATDHHNGTGFLPGWGYFGVSVQADSPETVATVVKFHVAPKYDNPTSHQCKCTEIAFVQYVSVKWHYFWGTSTEAWHIDTANPYPYPNGGKWTPGKGIAELVDNPGMNCGIGTYSFPCWWPWVNSLEMDFRDVAYCTKGKDKGDTVGTVTWGFKVSRTWEWLYIGGAHSLLALTVGIPGAANMQAGTTFVPTD